MSSEHLTKEMVHRFLLEELTLKDRRDLVRHLLTRCPACQAVAEEVAHAHGYTVVDGEFQSEEGAPDRYHETFLQVLGSGSELELRLARERLRGTGQWSALVKHSETRRLVEARNDPRLRHWGFLQACLDHAKAVGREDPVAAVDAAYLAVAVAERLDPAEYGRERVADFRASALAALGNAKRQAEDFHGASEAFQGARRALAEGTGDLSDKAELASLEASLHYDLGDFEAAVAALRIAVDIYRDLDDPHLMGRTLIKQANAIGHSEPERAVLLAQEALALIDAAREPIAELSAHYTLAEFLNESGKPQEALTVLELSRPLFRQFPLKPIQLRLHWMEAKIARTLGDLDESASTAERVRDDFLAAGMRQEFALASIDLAEARYQQGRHAGAIAAVEHAYAMLESWGMHKECLAILILLQKSIAEQKVTAGAFREMAVYLLRWWHRPARQG